MTDTIGWGDDEAPRRSGRWLWVGGWLVAALVVAGLLLAPVVRRHLADRDAAWLQREWASADVLTSARDLLVVHALERVGIGDDARYARVVEAVDAEAGARLERVRRAVDGHSHHGHDVRLAARAVQRALAAEERDLRAQAVRMVATRTDLLVRQARDAVAAAAEAHHVRVTRPASPRLLSGNADLAALLRVTDAPLPLRLVLAEGDLVVGWDLATGASRLLADASLDHGLGLLPGGDGVVFVSGDGGYRLLAADGRTVRLPRADQYVPLADGGVWRVLAGRVRRYDATMRPQTSWVSLPRRHDYVLAATTDALALQSGDPEATVTNGLWWPAGHREASAISSCPGWFVAARDEFAADDCSRRLVVVDPFGAHRVVLRPPPRYAFDGQALALSPDGHRLAGSVTPPAGRDSVDQPLRRVVVYDVATRADLVVPGSVGMIPVGWSADGTVLVLAQPSDSRTTALFPFVYWRVGDPTVHSIRMPGSAAFDGVVVLAEPAAQ